MQKGTSGLPLEFINIQKTLLLVQGIVQLKKKNSFIQIGCSNNAIVRRMSMGLVAIEVEVNPRGLVVVVE